PRSRKLAMALKATGRKRKEVNTAKEGSKHRRAEGLTSVETQNVVLPVSNSEQRTADRPEINLNVVLPMPASGILHLVDDEGDSVLDSFSVMESANVRKEDEAK
ncbi:hypothetical protein A2U01_0069281, partial [Trifolium medium]|nr:hypothetical protein [Trifolium medium]